jgi:hypothetical protein
MVTAAKFGARVLYSDKACRVAAVISAVVKYVPLASPNKFWTFEMI